MLLYYNIFDEDLPNAVKSTTSFTTLLESEVNIIVHIFYAIDRFPNYSLGARRGKDLVAKGCYGPWRILLNVNPPRFPVCCSV